jgi:hypothetical protein
MTINPVGIGVTNKADISMWSKNVKGIDWSKRGGWVIQGDFLDSDNLQQGSLDLLHTFEYRNTKKTIITCAQIKINSITARFVIVLFDSRKIKSDMGFPNVVASQDANGNTTVIGEVLHHNGDKLADVKAVCTTKNYRVAVFPNWEFHMRKNSLTGAAEFMDKHLDVPIKGSSKRQSISDMPVATQDMTKRQTTTFEAAPVVDPNVDPVTGLVPIKKEKQEKTKRKLKGFRLSRKDRLSANNGSLPLPDEVFYVIEINGIRVLSVGDSNELVFMHILADHENVSDEVRDFMRDQAEELRALAAAYEIVANAGDIDQKKVSDLPLKKWEIKLKDSEGQTYTATFPSVPTVEGNIEITPDAFEPPYIDHSHFNNKIEITHEAAEIIKKLLEDKGD